MLGSLDVLDYFSPVSPVTGFSGEYNRVKTEGIPLEKK